MENKKYLKRAEESLKILYEVIVEVLEEHPNGMSNSEITSFLGLESDQNGKQRNYLAYSLLGNLMSKGIVEKYKINSSVYYKLIK